MTRPDQTTDAPGPAGRPPTSPTLGDGVEDAAQATCARAVALGLLEQPAALAALEAWRREGAGQSFASHLVEHGLVGTEDAARLVDAAPAAAIAPGERASGCVLEKKLGQGGMGTVWLAHRESTGERVVVKFLNPGHAGDPAWRARFAREGLVARQIVHENVVRVYAVEVAGARPHIVMELVEGQDLADRLEAEGRVPALEAVRLARDVALGLAAAHALGVVHRDVKPGNVRVTADGRVKLLDFGLARGVLLEDGVSIAGQVLGTPHYMPPEQWGDHRVDARGDVYALGATLYHLVTGQVPFPGERPMEVCRRVLEGEFARPRELVPELPEALELVILRMMSRDRRCRYADGAAAARALQSVLDGGPVDVPALVERGDGRSHPLLPGTSFVLGSDPACEVRLDHPSVAARHARVDLGRAGFRLTDLSGSGGTLVDGVRVASAMLKPGDVLRLGEVELALHDAGVAGTAVGPLAAPGRLRVRGIPWPLFEALVQAGDRRVVLALMERLPLAPLEDDVRAGAALVRQVLGSGELAEEVRRRLDLALRARRARAPEVLFRITHENLGHDEEAWLTWWEEAWSAFPPQVAPAGRAPRWAVRVEGEGPLREVSLGERLVILVGRGLDSDLQLLGTSVSRHHATLLRLDRRLVIRDEGSRFGTQVRGAAVRLAFLGQGERVRLGNTTLVVEAEPEPVPAAGAVWEVDPDLFQVLVELHHPAVAVGLVRLAQAVEHLAWIEPLAAELHPAPARARALARAGQEGWSRRAAAALDELAALFPQGPGARAGVRAWRDHVARALPELGPQLVPAGWLGA